MKRLVITALAATLALPIAAQAKNDHGPKGNAHGQHASACPPGLAKKDPACVPPGLAKKAYRDSDDHHAHVRVGEVLDPAYIGSRYIVVTDPDRYGLDPRYSYYRIDDNLYRVNQDTREVLALIGAVSAILN